MFVGWGGVGGGGWGVGGGRGAYEDMVYSGIRSGVSRGAGKIG